ncbi:MAG: TraR/DksA C4-type zinc finger protein [bacterium]|nr:TraR/DksA C4-type zinc finger protein [bacterium]
MDSKILQDLKEQLEKTAGELEVEIKDAKKSPDFGSDTEGGVFEEEADEAEEEGLQLGVQQALKERLGDVENAIEKIVRGNYGKCEKCSMEISMEVLRVNPESRFCKDCKNK